MSPTIGQCELTYTERSPIDVNLARAQHAAYRQLLTELGCTVIHLPAEPTLPDSVFVEDGAVVLDDLAVLTWPGAESRRGETASLRDALAPYRPLAELTPPAILDGGDVLIIDRKIWIGLSTRTNKAGIEQFQHLVKLHGYEVKPIEICGILHLKSAVTVVAEDTVLLNPEWIDPAFDGYRTIAVDPSEPLAANVLRVGQTPVISSSHPRTTARLEADGIQCRSVASSELEKAEGALTCCSLLFEV